MNVRRRGACRSLDHALTLALAPTTRPCLRNPSEQGNPARAATVPPAMADAGHQHR